jgi:hypothetical protein
MKNFLMLLLTGFFTFQFSWGSSSVSKAAIDMENEIAGGKPTDVKVKVIKNRFFLEGSVDKDSEKKFAGEVCRAYAANTISLKSSGFKSIDDLCVNLVKVRDALLPDPPKMIRVEYRVLYIPNTKISVGNILSKNFFNSTDLPNDARLIKSVAFNLVDETSLSSNSNSHTDLAASITTEKFNINTEENANNQYTLETATKTASIIASDKIIIDADVKLANTSSQFERRIKTKIIANNEETAGLSSWINLDEKDLKSPGLIILVKASRLRSGSDDNLQLEKPVSPQ